MIAVDRVALLAQRHDGGVLLVLLRDHDHQRRVRLALTGDSPGTLIACALGDGGTDGYPTSSLKWPNSTPYVVISGELTALPPPPPPPPPASRFATNAGKESSTLATDDYGVPFKPPFASE